MNRNPNLSLNIAVTATTPLCFSYAQELAQELHLPFVEEGDQNYPLLLTATAERLELRQVGKGRTNPI